GASVRLAHLSQDTVELPGDRIGIVGVNGSGKSTLMRAIYGDVALSAGRRKVGKTVSMAYLTQEVRELDRFADWRVIEAIEDVKQYTRLGDKEVSASQLAKRLGFSGGRQQTRVSDLSGGERRRLQFLRLLMAEPNVLILDEPTNDLDIETLTSMEDVLDGWAGTLLVVSHDRYLLERMCDRQVALLGDGAVRDLPGGVEQYLELRHASRTAAAASAATAGSRVALSSGNGRGGDAAGHPQSAAELREAKKDLNRIDRQLSRLAVQEDKIHVEMAAKAADHTAVLALNNTLRAIVEDRETLELEWLSVAEVIG
ncbi:MAG TPA: ATP-binding cassette domain-containing protein, partial [Dermatophilaceae bacterium]